MKKQWQRLSSVPQTIFTVIYGRLHAPWGFTHAGQHSLAIKKFKPLLESYKVIE